jgi:hypothetical protein
VSRAALASNRRGRAPVCVAAGPLVFGTTFP